MEFLDKLGKKASEAYKVTADKTGKIAKEAKLRMKMGELKSEIKDIYEDIGKVVYENHVREEKQDINKDIEEKCTKIDCLSDEIESILKECLLLKDKKQCPSCYKEIEKDVKFCPECGTKQELDAEVVESAKEGDVVEHQNQNHNENVNNGYNNKDSLEKDVVNEDKSSLERTVEVESDVDEDHDETVEYLEIEDDTVISE